MLWPREKGCLTVLANLISNDIGDHDNVSHCSLGYIIVLWVISTAFQGQKESLLPFGCESRKEGFYLRHQSKEAKETQYAIGE